MGIASLFAAPRPCVLSDSLGRCQHGTDGFANIARSVWAPRLSKVV
jgi:hypothetical protein